MTATLDLEVQWRGRRYKDAAQGLEALAKGILNVEAAGPAVSKKIREFLQDFHADLSAIHGRPWPGGTSPAGARPGRLSRRSGRLLDSIKNSINVTGDLTSEIQGRIGSNTRYGGIQEHGGVIRPKRAQYLTVPLPAALNSDGTPKRRKARDWDDTFVLKSKAGNLLIVQKKGGRLIPLYVLKKQVTIPPRLSMGFFLDKAREPLGEVIVETIVRELVKAEQGAGQG